MRKAVVFLLIFPLFSISILSQECDSCKTISGLICDSETLAPLPDATMIFRNRHFLPDMAGRISASVATSDTLYFRHIGYKEARLVIGDTLTSQSLFAVFLSRDTVMLSEVVVVPRIYRLAEMSRYMPVVQTPADIYANQNIRRSTHTALTQPAMGAWTAEDNQRRTISRFAYEQEYRHMLAPDQMVGISNAAIAAIAGLIKKMVADDERQPVKPITEHEMKLMLQLYSSTMSVDSTKVNP